MWVKVSISFRAWILFIFSNVTVLNLDELHFSTDVSGCMQPLEALDMKGGQQEEYLAW